MSVTISVGKRKMFETQIAILIILIILSAFFSAIETALMSLNMVKVNSLVKQKKKGSLALQRVKQNQHRLLITILVGNNLVNIAAASLATVISMEMFGSAGVGIATGVMTFLILVFGEITPKTFAAQNAQRISLAVARPVEVFSYILWPVSKVFEVISRAMSRVLGSKKESLVSEEELRTIVTLGKEEGVLSKEAAEMMHNLLRFEKTKVTEIMTPKNDVEMLNGMLTVKKVLDTVVKSRYSRFPVFKGSKDNIIGVLDVDIVLKCVKSNKVNVRVSSIVTPPYFIPESKNIDDLLSEFESKKVPVAIIVDEYGCVVGLVTVEDILEEIVGEIFDKSKKQNTYIKTINEKTFEVNALAPFKKINRILKFEMENENSGEFDTFAGFLEKKLQRIPESGETIEFKKFSVKIEEVTDRDIKTVRIIKH